MSAHSAPTTSTTDLGVEMKTKNRDLLVLRVLRLMQCEINSGKRYDLQILGESLINEYRDLKKDEVTKKLDEKYPH